MTDQSPLCFIVLADLHLSDTPDTAAHHALAWAIDTINEKRPDFLAVAGDVTTFGTRPATAHFLTALERVQVPVLFTPGNAELRSDEGLPLLRDRLAPANRHFQSGAFSALFPDTSTGALPAAERQWLEQMASAHPTAHRILVTHYPLDALQPESAAWLEPWLAAKRIELLAPGHRHFPRRSRFAHSSEWLGTRAIRRRRRQFGLNQEFQHR